ERDRVGAPGDLLPDGPFCVEGISALVDIGGLHSVAHTQGAGVGLLLADDHTEERGLARAVGTDDADDAAAGQRERQAFDQDPILIVSAPPEISSQTVRFASRASRLWST